MWSGFAVVGYQLSVRLMAQHDSHDDGTQNEPITDNRQRRSQTQRSGTLRGDA
jgi:hypothetical protein